MLSCFSQCGSRACVFITFHSKLCLYSSSFHASVDGTNSVVPVEMVLATKASSSGHKKDCTPLVDDTMSSMRWEAEALEVVRDAILCIGKISKFNCSGLRHSSSASYNCRPPWFRHQQSCFNGYRRHRPHEQQSVFVRPIWHSFYLRRCPQPCTNHYAPRGFVVSKYIPPFAPLETKNNVVATIATKTKRFRRFRR